MIPNATRLGRRLIAVGVAVLLAACGGCTARSSYRFQFVDAETGQPLPGVRVTFDQGGHHFNNRMFPATYNTNLPDTGADGTVEAKLKIPELQYWVCGLRQGYRAVLARSYDTVRPGNWLISYAASESLEDAAGTRTTWDGYWNAPLAPDRVLRIPMHRIGGAAPATSAARPGGAGG